MKSPIGNRNIIDIKVEKYKQIIPDNYIGMPYQAVIQLPVAMAWERKLH